MKSQAKFQYYQITLIFSILFSLLGFSYNVWRMEVSEQNNTLRTASFEILVKLSSLEELIYTGHYDGDLIAGSPRKGWVIVGLVNDLSVLLDPSIQKSTAKLVKVWSKSCATIGTKNNSVADIMAAVDEIRTQIKVELKALK